MPTTQNLGNELPASWVWESLLWRPMTFPWLQILASCIQDAKGPKLVFFAIFFQKYIYIYIRVIFPMCSKLPKNWGFAHYKWLDGWTLTTATWLQPRQATPRKSWRWRNKGRPWALSWPRLKITAGWLGLGVWQERQNGGIFWALSKHYDGGKGKVDRAPLNKHE